MAQLVKKIHLPCGRPGIDPWVVNIPWKSEQLPSPVFWPGEFHGLYSPWRCKQSDTTERLSLLFSLTWNACWYPLPISPLGWLLFLKTERILHIFWMSILDHLYACKYYLLDCTSPFHILISSTMLFFNSNMTKWTKFLLYVFAFHLLEILANFKIINTF